MKACNVINSSLCLCSLRRQGAAVLDQPAPSVCQTPLRQQCQGNTHAHTHIHTHTQWRTGWQSCKHDSSPSYWHMFLPEGKWAEKPRHFPRDPCSLRCVLFMKATVSRSSKLGSGLSSIVGCRSLHKSSSRPSNDKNMKQKVTAAVSLISNVKKKANARLDLPFTVVFFGDRWMNFNEGKTNRNRWSKERRQRWVTSLGGFRSQFRHQRFFHVWGFFQISSPALLPH